MRDRHQPSASRRAAVWLALAVRRRKSAIIARSSGAYCAQIWSIASFIPESTRKRRSNSALPRLTAKPAAGTYRTAIDRNLARGSTISRADLAACMLTLLDDPATFSRHVCIAN